MRIHGPYKHRARWRLAFRTSGSNQLFYRSFETKEEAETFMLAQTTEQDDEALSLLKSDAVPLPDDPAWAYLLLDDDDQVVYVGITRELDRRYFTHRENGAPFARMAFFPDAVDRVTGLKIEAALIRKYNPPLNKAGIWETGRETDRYVPRVWKSPVPKT